MGRTRSEKTFIIYHFIFLKAKLLRARTEGYQYAVNWNLLKMDCGIEFLYGSKKQERYRGKVLKSIYGLNYL